MISVCMMRFPGGRLCGFSSRGHAGYAASGKDIVCAAVSALTQTCVIGLTEVIGLDADVRCSEEDGIHCMIRPETDAEGQRKAELLLETLQAGLASIQASYPGTLKLRVREV